MSQDFTDKDIEELQRLARHYGQRLQSLFDEMAARALRAVREMDDDDAAGGVAAEPHGHEHRRDAG